MKKNIYQRLLPLLFLPVIACGQQGNKVQGVESTTQPIVKEASESVKKKIKETLEQNYQEQNVQVKSISGTPVAGIYEVVVNGPQILYTDTDANYLFAGDMIDIKGKKSLTQERMQELSRINFDELPLQKAIKEVRGNGKLKVAVFSDPDCPYCKKLEEELAKINDITVYTFLMPIASLHPNAKEKSIQIWCSKDPGQTWGNWMRKKVSPTGDKNCKHPIDETIALGESLGFTGTPTMVLPSGLTQPGFAPKEALLELITKNQKPAN